MSEKIDKIKEFRLKNGLRQEDIARDLEISREYYSLLEKNRVKISPKIEGKLARFCEKINKSKENFTSESEVTLKLLEERIGKIEQLLIQILSKITL